MRIIDNPPRSGWAALTLRKGVDYESIRPRVEAILKAVEEEGDAALLRLMKEIDGADAPLEVSAAEVDCRYSVFSYQLKVLAALAALVVLGALVVLVILVLGNNSKGVP